MRIAVLDTGIDCKHDEIIGCEENIRGKRCFIPDKSDTAVEDTCGHGTFITGLVLDYAPDANIYIARIAENKRPISPGVVAKVCLFPLLPLPNMHM